MLKTSEKNDQLKIAFQISLNLARKITQREHRANPMLNILNMTAKTAAQFPDLTGKKSTFWRY